MTHYFGSQRAKSASEAAQKISRQMAAKLFGGDRKALERASKESRLPQFNNGTRLHHPEKIGSQGGSAWKICGADARKVQETVRAIETGQFASLMN